MNSVGLSRVSTSPTTVLAGLERPSSRGRVLQQKAISSSPVIVDMRGSSSVPASLKAVENDYKRDMGKHFAIVSAAITADHTASDEDKEYLKLCQSYKESLDAALYHSLGVVTVKVVENPDLATIFASYARTNTNKTNPELANLARLNSTLQQSTQARLATLKRAYYENLEAKQAAPKRPRTIVARTGHAINLVF